MVRLCGKKWVPGSASCLSFLPCRCLRCSAAYATYLNISESITFHDAYVRVSVRRALRPLRLEYHAMGNVIVMLYPARCSEFHP